MVGYTNLEERVDKDFAVARTFAWEGARVFLAGRTREPLEVVAAYYRGGDKGPYSAHAIIVLAIEGEEIASLVYFADPSIFGQFGLPTTLGD